MRNENVYGSQRRQTSGNAAHAVSGHEARSAPGSAFHTGSSSILRKVAKLESKLMNRRKQMEPQNIDLGLKSLVEESSSSPSSHEHRARGKKYQKSCATPSGNMTHSNARSKEEETIQSLKENVVIKQQLGLDGVEEEMRELMDGSLDFSCRNKNRRGVVSDSKWGVKGKSPISSGMPPPSQKATSPTVSQHHSITVVSKASYYSEDLMKNGFGGINSPASPLASRNLSVQHNMRSRSLSSVKDNTVKITLPRTGNTMQCQMSPESDRSEIKSLDDLFSKEADSEDSISSNSDGFRLNILSLDDLAPNTTSEAVELKWKETDTQITQRSNRNPKKDTSLVAKDQASLKMTSAITGVNDASEGDSENNVTEAEIPEHLSGVCADSPRHKQDYLYHDETTVSSEYAVDFGRSLAATDRGAVLKESEEYSESCTYSGKHPPSASSPSSTRKLCGQVHRVTVKETGVQTVDPSFSYCWPKANTSAVLDPPVGNSYVDPVPIASHVISMDAVEALTAYSPSVLVLNAMLKQHLMLTQQFIENIQHLHLSIVESLENEKFHYHTLEEAKEYIKAHRSAPLTVKETREERRRAQEEKLP